VNTVCGTLLYKLLLIWQGFPGQIVLFGSYRFRFSICLENSFFSYYIYLMTITQTVEIPANRRITLEVPREVPIGKANVEYNITPFIKNKTKQRMTEKEEIEWINKNIEWLNKEAIENLSYQYWNPLEDENK